MLFWFLAATGAWAPLSACLRPFRRRADHRLTMFWSKPFLWFYLYFAVAVLVFYAFWAWYSPHPWQNWSILGSALILFIVLFPGAGQRRASTTGTGRSGTTSSRP